LLILAFTPLALSGWIVGGGGGGGSSPSGTNYTVTGTVNGGYAPLPSGTVTLYVPNSSDTGFKEVGTASINSNGSYTISYTGGSNQDFLVMVTTPSGNTMYNIGYSSGTSNVTININELTTAQTVYAFIHNNGTSSGNLPSGTISSTVLTSWYHSIPSDSQSLPNTSVSGNLKTWISEIEDVAQALASCVQSTTYCSKIKSAITSVTPSYSPGTGTLVYDLIEDNNNNSVQLAMNNLMSQPSNLNLPWSLKINTFIVGISPYAIAIDGSGNVWVANEGNGTVGTSPGDNVTELTASSNYTTSNTYVTGSGPDAIAIDGSGNVWVANEGLGTVGTASGDSNVTELTASSNYTKSNTYVAGSNPVAIAIDGSGNVWVANEVLGTASSNSNVTELSSTGKLINTYTAGSDPDAIAIDGSGNVWVVNDGNGTVGTASGDSNVTELTASSNYTKSYTYTAGSYPQAIAIDGLGNIWVANAGNGTPGTALGDSNVTELSPTGSIIGTYVAGIGPDAIAIDGSGNVWVANNNGSNTVTELNSTTGTFIDTYTVGSEPYAIAIDGSGNVWVANSSSNTVTEIVALQPALKRLY